jgi:hypothetical protein
MLLVVKTVVELGEKSFVDLSVERWSDSLSAIVSIVEQLLNVSHVEIRGVSRIVPRDFAINIKGNIEVVQDLVDEVTARDGEVLGKDDFLWFANCLQWSTPVQEIDPIPFHLQSGNQVATIDQNRIIAKDLCLLLRIDILKRGLNASKRVVGIGVDGILEIRNGDLGTNGIKCIIKFILLAQTVLTLEPQVSEIAVLEIRSGRVTINRKERDEQEQRNHLDYAMICYLVY